MSLQPYSGDYFYAYWYEYNERTDNFREPPIEIRFRPYDTSQRDIGTGISDEGTSQELQGFPLTNYSMVVRVLDEYNYKVGDKFKDLTDEKTYYIKKIGKGYDSINAIGNLMFPSTVTLPKILYLGDISG